MQLIIKIDDYDFNKLNRAAIEKAIQEYVEPKVAEYLTKYVNAEEVARIIESRMSETLNYGTYDSGKILSDKGVAALLDKAISKVAQSITDEELKNFILERLINKLK